MVIDKRAGIIAPFLAICPLDSSELALFSKLSRALRCRRRGQALMGTIIVAITITIITVLR